MITLPFHAPEGYRPALSTDALEGYWFVYREDKLLIHGSARPGEISQGEVPAVPYGAPPALAPASRTIYLGRLGEHHCFALEADAATEAPTGMDWTSLRGLFTRIDDALFAKSPGLARDAAFVRAFDDVRALLHAVGGGASIEANAGDSHVIAWVPAFA